MFNKPPLLPYPTPLLTRTQRQRREGALTTVASGRFQNYMVRYVCARRNLTVADWGSGWFQKKWVWELPANLNLRWVRPSICFPSLHAHWISLAAREGRVIGRRTVSRVASRVHLLARTHPPHELHTGAMLQPNATTQCSTQRLPREPSPHEAVPLLVVLGVNRRFLVQQVLLRRQTKLSKMKGKMGTKWESLDGPNGRQPTASRCDLYL